jgi:hypothetical protein
LEAVDVSNGSITWSANLVRFTQELFPKRLPGDDAGAIDVPSTFGNTTLGSFTAAGPAPTPADVLRANLYADLLEPIG